VKRIISLLCTMTMVATFAVGQNATGAATDLSRAGASPVDLSPVYPSPAEQNIAEARKAISEKPVEYAGYNLLAAALVRRAEETSDVAFYTQAEDAVKKSLEVAPKNFDAEKIKVSILLGEHAYPAALEAAKVLNKRIPDDVMVYGLLTDANVALGNYKDAEDSAQWMLNLRPGNLPALIRAAGLRELFGETEGAYELVELAYQSTPATDIPARAALLSQLGHLRFASGNVDSAEKLLQQALTFDPSFPAALKNLAELRIAQKRYPDAVTLLQKRRQSVPSPANLYQLAQALQLAGQGSDAKKAFAEFERQALRESDKKDNANRELIFYYADHAQQPAKALQVAQQEFAWRRDVFTLDAYAWALHVKGQNAEARRQIDTALAVGIRDASLFLHAGEISLALGDRSAAEHYLQQSAQLNCTDSEQARNMLTTLTTHSGR
jgi:tetratricopeptide (TPR) repeat protein